MKSIFITSKYKKTNTLLNTVFKIITGEDWNNAMYEGINAYGGPKSVAGIGAGLYFIVVTCLGNCIIS